jgi:hypothetical protein
MFDGLDVMPLCVAPLLGWLCGGLVFIFWLVIQKASQKKYAWANPLVGVLTFGLAMAVCGLSFMLQIGTAVPTPWAKPTMLDIAGEWSVSRCTAKRFTQQWHNFSGVKRTIEFKSDGTFVAKNLPALWELHYDQSEKTDGEYLSGSGTWFVNEVSGRIGNREWMLYTKSGEINRELAFYFDGQLPPYNLAYSKNINLVILTKSWLPLGDSLCP